MLYALFGIPLTLVLLTALVDRLMIPTTKYLHFLNSRLGHLYPPFTIRLLHFGTILGTLIFLFLLMPAAMFTYLEPEWNYMDSLYYCFISLTTIGLGDYIPGDAPDQKYRPLYKLMITGNNVDEIRNSSYYCKPVQLITFLSVYIYIYRLPGRGTCMCDVNAVYFLRYPAIKLWRAFHVGKRRNPFYRHRKNAFTRTWNKQDQVHKWKRFTHKLGGYNSDTQHSLKLGTYIYTNINIITFSC